jgi:hypothetical protein
MGRAALFVPTDLTWRKNVKEGEEERGWREGGERAKAYNNT